LLHNLQSGGIAWVDVITCFSVRLIFIGFFR
jgi:hypothetical protein